MNSTISSSSCRPLGQGAIYNIYNLAIYNIAKLVVILFFYLFTDDKMSR